jgi:hypothetical protein
VRTLTSRLFGAAIEGALISLLVVGLLVVPAFAAKGGNGGKPSGGGTNGTISVAMMDGATEAHFAARVTFTVSTTATASPFVHLRCYQGGTLVGEGRQGFFEGALGNPWFYLGPTPAWQAGDADCTATLERSTRKGWSVLATTPSFHVYP